MPQLQTFDKNFKRVGILVDAYDIQRRRRINSDYTLDFLLPMSSADFREKVPLKGHVQDERGQYYVINTRQRVRDGRKLTAAISCSHIMFKLADFKFPYASYISEAYGVPITRLTDLISAATGGKFRFSVDDTFDLYDVKDFGRGNCLQALNSIITMYKCEVDPDNFTIHLRKKIGGDHGLQYRLRKNVVSSTFKDDGSSLVTRMFAQMKDGRTWIGMDASNLTDEERSLLAQVPGAIVGGKLAVNYLISPYAASWANDANAFYDGEITEQDVEDPLKLLEAARKALREQEVPALEVTVHAADIYKLDAGEPQPHLGDTVSCIDPDVELAGISARITELTEYPYNRDKHSQVTVANVMMRDYADIIADLDRSKRMIENMFSGGQIRTDVFEAAAKQAVADITNSKTELIYPESGGILAQEKGNALNQVRLTSAGLGISTDGWKTVRSAVTARGVLAENVIGQFGNFVSMLIGSGNNITQINTNGIAAGHANFNSAPFRVDMAGNVTANRLTANSANIFSSNFQDGAIVGSSINVGSGQFTVDRYGNMYAGNGTFRGSISASTITGGTINGTTIIGASIKTALSGERIELDPYGFVFYDVYGARRVTLGTNQVAGISGHTYYNSSGSSLGLIYASPDELHVIGNRSLRLGANGGTIYLQGPVSFTNGSSVSGLSLGISQISGLQTRLDNLQSQIDSLRSSYSSHTHSVYLPSHNHGNNANQNWGGTNYPTSTP